MKFWVLGIMAALVLLASCAVRTPEQETAHDDRQYRKVLDSYWRDLKPRTSGEEARITCDRGCAHGFAEVPMC
jgi:hypothetical protein